MENQVLKEKYVIQKQLSKNAGRQTLLARDIQTQKLVVIKLLMFGEYCNWDDLKLFERQAQTLKILEHPAIPRYLDYFDLDTSSGQGFALVQNYIPAKSLEKWLKGGRTFSEQDVKQLAQSLLEILRYLHDQQPPVIHRDIKPSNILLGNRSGNSVGQVYLVDFGSVQTIAAQKGSTITVVGTYGYMPPEQFGGRTVPASDLYSLGATLIYLVTGLHPADLPQENLRIQFESSVNLSSDLINWLKWMTQPSLNCRLASAGEALKALEYPRQPTDISGVVKKPFGSEIQVKKHGENVEIYIPRSKLTSGSVIRKLMSDTDCSGSMIMGFVFLLFGTVLGLLSIVIFLGSISEAIVSGVFATMFMLFMGSIFGGVGLLLMYDSPVIQSFFRVIRLYLDKEKINCIYEWDYEWMGRKIHNDPIMKKDISKLFYSLSYWRTNEKGTNTKFIPPEITITIVAQPKRKFSVYHLSDPEMDWLAHEISEWSGVPITFEE